MRKSTGITARIEPTRIAPPQELDSLKSDFVYRSGPSGLPPIGDPVAPLGFWLSLLQLRQVLCSPVPSVVALGWYSFCNCPF